MPSSIYYPRTATSYRDIANANCPADMTSEEFEQRILSANGRSSGNSAICQPNRPIVLPSDDQDRPVSIAPLLACTAEEHRTLSHLSHYAGGAAVMGLANFLWDTRIPSAVGDLNTFGGNGMGAAVAQSNSVLKAIDKFDRANAYATALVNHRAAPTSVDIAKLRARLAFNEMNQLMNAKSLNYLNNNTFGMRPTTTVTGRSVWEPIPVGESADVQRLRNLVRAGRVAGPGFILLDGYMRASNVHNSWQNGDPNWQREAVVEGASFGVGIGAGVAIGLIVAVTPVGLAIGIVAGGAAAIGADHLAKGFVGRVYDWWRS